MTASIRISSGKQMKHNGQKPLCFFTLNQNTEDANGPASYITEKIAKKILLMHRMNPPQTIRDILPEAQKQLKPIHSDGFY